MAGYSAPRYGDISRLQYGFDMVTLPPSVSPLFVCLQCHKYIMNLGSLNRAIHPSSEPLQLPHTYMHTHAKKKEQRQQQQQLKRDAAGIIIANPIFFMAT